MAGQRRPWAQAPAGHDPWNARPVSDFEILPHLSEERPELHLRINGRWRSAQVESWQQIVGRWWASCTFLTVGGAVSRTSVLVRQIRPSDA